MAWRCATCPAKIRVVAIRRARSSNAVEHPPRRDTRLAPHDDAYLVGPYAELLEVLRHDREGRSPAPGGPLIRTARSGSTVMSARSALRSSPPAVRSSGTRARGARAARSTAPGIASSSGSRPAAMSRCIELPSVCVRALELLEGLLGSTSWAPSACATAQASSIAPTSSARSRGVRADLAEQLVVCAGGAGERVQAHELGPHHLRLGVQHPRRHAAPRRARPRAPASPERADRLARPCRSAGTGSCARPRRAAGRSASTRIAPASTDAAAQSARAARRGGRAR